MNHLRNRTPVIVLIVTLVTFTILTNIVEDERLKLYLDSGRVGVWAAVWFITFRLAIEFFWVNRRRTGGEILAIAINITAGMILVQAVWIPFNREIAAQIGMSQSMRDDISQLVVLGYIAAGVFYLLPIGNTIGITPPRNYWFLLAAGVIGALVAGIMIGVGIQSGPA